MKNDPSEINNSRFFRACNCEPTDVTPIWLMRQAGRYMPEYRRLREQYGILEIIKAPELACEVTLQPIHAFDLDAAIIFSDILPPLEGMGLNLRFVSGKGPVIHNPIRSNHDIEKLQVTAPEEAMGFTLAAIRLVRRELDAQALPLIGFSGAPFTLACYAIEGGTSRNYAQAKKLMFGDPKAWHKLMEKLSEVVGTYLVAQARAGANVLQIFDSWAGELTPSDYMEKALPYTQKSIDMAKTTGVPIIHFGTNTNGMLELMKQTGADIIGVDWRIGLDNAWHGLNHEVAIQGNLDPTALLGPWPELKQRAKRVLDQAAGRHGHIFNLGHGILPQTPVDNVKRLVDFVHEEAMD